MSAPCKYDLAWCGPCGKPVVEGSEYCEAHHGKECTVCKHQAVRECSYTGQFVCGAPLCENCEGHENRPGDPGYTTNPGLGWGFMNHTHRAKPKKEASE